MQQITVRLPEGLLADVEAEAEQEGESRSEYIRDLLDARGERIHIDEFQAIARRLRAVEEELAEVEARRDDLRRQLSAANSREKDVGELVEYVQEERSLQQRREERERMRETAGVFTRAKWWLTGMPEIGVDDEE